jgi:hypothetical protein
MVFVTEILTDDQDKSLSQRHFHDILIWDRYHSTVPLQSFLTYL